MHSAAFHLVPVLAAEKSKLAFYIAGGALALWAVIVSLGIGLRSPDFPRNNAGERVVILISVVLVAAAMTTAVLTSGTPAKATSDQGTPTAAAPNGGGSTTTLALAADPGGQLRFDKSTLQARSGRVTIDFTNNSTLAHDVVIARGSTVLAATPVKMGPATLSVSLKPGTYTFYCAVPGHEQAGMKGTLTVG